LDAVGFAYLVFIVQFGILAASASGRKYLQRAKRPRDQLALGCELLLDAEAIDVRPALHNFAMKSMRQVDRAMAALNMRPQFLTDLLRSVSAGSCEREGKY
jgi:hypothetical protein